MELHRNRRSLPSNPMCPIECRTFLLQSPQRPVHSYRKFKSKFSGRNSISSSRISPIGKRICRACSWKSNAPEFRRWLSSANKRVLSRICSHKSLNLPRLILQVRGFSFSHSVFPIPLSVSLFVSCSYEVFFLLFHQCCFIRCFCAAHLNKFAPSEVKSGAELRALQLKLLSLVDAVSSELGLRAANVCAICMDLVADHAYVLLQHPACFSLHFVVSQLDTVWTRLLPHLWRASENLSCLSSPGVGFAAFFRRIR